ncbi:MAG: hypothetical protein R3A44_24215 [Caldilineaceae bacterium]
MTLKNELYTWLLKSEIPSIRYKTLVDLLEYPPHQPCVENARRAVAHTGPVPAILAGQAPNGAWAKENSYYSPKYVSTHWSMLLLTELGIDPEDAHFQRGVDFMLNATRSELEARMNASNLGFSCFWGNLLRYALYAGRYDDAQGQKLIQYAARDLHRGPCQCAHNDNHACAWGVARMLWGLALIPTAHRTRQIGHAIDAGVKFLLHSFQLLDANYPTPDDGKIHSLWFRLNFPLFYQADILFVLRVLADLHRLDHPGAQPALNWLQTRQQSNGRWRGSSPYRARTWRAIGDAAEIDRWVSLQSATILRRAGRF